MPSMIHRCQFPETPDYIFTSKSRRSSNCLRIIRSLISINKKHPHCKKYGISNATVTKQKKNQILDTRQWIIHPFSILRFSWDITMTLVYLITFVTIPFMICCIVMDFEKIRMDNVNLYIYGIFWIDIAGNCVTGFYDENSREFILDWKKILKRYTKGYFIIDVITSLPYDRITLPWRSIPGPSSSFSIAIINLIPILKLTRYFTLISYISQLFMCFSFSNFSYKIWITLMLYFYLFYWFACFCYVTPIMVMYGLYVKPEDCEDCWLTRDKGSGIEERFRQAFFMVLENFSASSYGGIIPETEGHIMMCTILMLLGRLYICYIIILFIRISLNKNVPEAEYQEVMDQVKAYANQKQLPPPMKKRLFLYYYHRFKNNYFRESEILSNLSENLRREIVLHSCRRLVENSTILKNLPKEALSSMVVLALKPELYLPNDLILKAGAPGDCMYFLDSGSVGVFTPTGKEICHFEDGAFFGEVALLVQDQRRIASVVALTVCEVYRLDRKDFRKYIAVHKEALNNIERIATERMERTVLIDEQVKQFK